MAANKEAVKAADTVRDSHSYSKATQVNVRPD